MEIDLNKALSYLHGDITPSKIKAILADMYPEEKMRRNLLAMVVECGLISKIQSSDIVSTQDYSRYQKILIDDYGIEQSNAEWALLTWINVYAKLEDRDVSSSSNIPSKQPAPAKPQKQRRKKSVKPRSDTASSSSKPQKPVKQQKPTDKQKSGTLSGDEILCGFLRKLILGDAKMGKNKND